MADQVVIKVPRDELVAALGNNPRLVRAFENLMREVTVILPGETTLVLEIAQSARSTSEGLGLGVFGPRAPAPKSIRPGAGITSAADAAGQVLSADAGYIAQAARAFGPRAPAPQPQKPATDAQDILAARVFNRR